MHSPFLPASPSFKEAPKCALKQNPFHGSPRAARGQDPSTEKRPQRAIVEEKKPWKLQGDPWSDDGEISELGEQLRGPNLSDHEQLWQAAEAI